MSDRLLLVDGESGLLLVDGTSFLLLAPATPTGEITSAFPAFQTSAASSAPVTGDAASTFPAFTTAATATTPVTATAASTLPAFTSTALGFVGDPPDLTPTPPVSPTWAPSLLRRVSPIMPAPTLDGFGRPQGWQPTSVITEPWGSLLVTVGGVDVTMFRDAPAEIVSWSYAQPFSDETLVLRLPQVSPLEPRTGDLAFLSGHPNVELWRVWPDGEVEPLPLWEGMFAAPNVEVTATSAALELTCIGALHQLSLFNRAPGISDRHQDIRSPIAAQFNLEARPSGRWDYMAGPAATGIESNYRGSRETALQFVLRLLQFAVEDSGVHWTISKEPGRLPVLHTVDTTIVHHTVSAGAQGVELSLRQEPLLQPNVVYGEGEDSGGLRWRNMVVPGGGGNVTPVFLPVASLPEVDPLDDDGQGGFTEDWDRVDTAIPRVEAFINFGQGISLQEARNLAEGIVTESPPWVGTVTLTTDTEEGHRLDIRAGHNLRIRHFYGDTLDVHVVRVDVQMGGEHPTVTLTVDQAARDIQTVEAVLERRREDVTQPMRRVLVGRASTEVKDSQVPWDSQGGSGVIPHARAWNPSATISLPAGTYVVVAFPASERDTIIDTRFQTSPATPFHVSIFDRAPSGLPANPFSEGVWDTPPAGYVIGWGQFDQRAGYSPGLESEGDPVTGVLMDQATWQYSHDGVPDEDRRPQMLWAVFFAPSACSVWGRIRRGVGT